VNGPIDFADAASRCVFCLANSLIRGSLLRGYVIWASVPLSRHPCGNNLLQRSVEWGHKKDELRIVHLLATKTQTEPSVEWEANFHLQDFRLLLQESSHAEYKLAIISKFECLQFRSILRSYHSAYHESG
jgi:hypothetical protein